MLSCLQAEINTWVVLSVALPGMTSDPNVMLPAASVGMLLAIGTAGLTVSITVATGGVSCVLSAKQGHSHQYVNAAIRRCIALMLAGMLAGMWPHV